MTCPTLASGSIELYFYGELSAADRAGVQAHVKRCAECRRALDDLTVIRAALGTRPDVSTPPAGDWTGFMARLDAAVEEADRGARGMPTAASDRALTFSPRGRVVTYLAMAALVVLTAGGVVLVRLASPARPETPQPAAIETAAPISDAVRAGSAATTADPALVSLSEQHFERSKLVVLGLATRDAAQPGGSWDYERGLASALLTDTRLYRQAAEDRGMDRLADVMRDLELVLLQTSMAEEPDRQSLEQLQRLIQRRNLITKMNVVHAGG